MNFRPANQPTQSPHSPVMADRVATGLPAAPNARFQNALDAVLRQQLPPDEFRSSLLQAAVQHGGFVGAAWYRMSGAELIAETEFLEHPALQHDSVRNSVREHSVIAGRQRRELVAPHTLVGNLVQHSVPVVRPDHQTEVISLLSTTAGDGRPAADLTAARSLVRVTLLRFAQQELQSSTMQLRTTAALLELAEKIDSTDTLSEAHRILADAVREYLDCEFVAVGHRPEKRITCEVAAVAAMSGFDRRSERTRQLKAALDESLVRQQFTSWPASDPGNDHQTVAHRQLAAATQVEVVVSLPLRCPNGEVSGAIVVGGHHNLLSEDAAAFLRTLDLPAGTSLRAVRRIQGGRLRQVCRAVFARRKKSTVLTVAFVAMAVIALLLVPVPYRVACSFRCEPVQSHFTVAPYGGLLEATLAEPGDVVKAGQLLARMDARELRWELAGVTAERNRADKQRDVHLADEAIADSIMSALEVDRLDGRRDLITHRLEQLEIRSECDGVVLSGSLERKTNYPVEVGQKLFEIAPVESLRMEVSVPEEEIDQVREGMPVFMRLDSNPSRIYEGVVERIRPRAEIVNDQNVFVAEVTLDNSDGLLRPGMEGVARIRSDSHPLGWNLFHRAWEYTVSHLLW